MNDFSRRFFLSLKRCIPPRLFQLFCDCDWFWRLVRRYQRRKVLRHYRDSSDREIVAILGFLRDHEANTFNTPFTLEYLDRPVDIRTDKASGLLYVDEPNGPLFFRRGITPSRAAMSYNCLCMEQDPRSPHAYLPPPFSMPRNGVLLDIGCAEALFTLRHIHEIQAACLFECDPAWQEALQHTFAPYAEKIHIVRKYVSDKTTGGFITLDDFAAELSSPIGFVKMDIEGMEEQALAGASRLIANGRVCHWAICTYHHPGAEQAIRDFFHDGYRLETSKGYMLSLNNLGLSAPYLRRGILHAQRIQSDGLK